jgi:hypothetical protein
MMRTNASLHADQARWHVGKSRIHLATRPLLPQHDRPALIKANNVERVLTNIDAHYDDHGVQYLRHGVLLVFGAYCQLRSLAGQEHGRTIPLADIYVRQNQRPRTTAASIPTNCAAMKATTPVGAMPAKVSDKERAMVTAGLAKDVEAVNQ